jgi:threonine/homoserine efflux transporter RhtA
VASPSVALPAARFLADVAAAVMLAALTIVVLGIGTAVTRFPTSGAEDQTALRLELSPG